MKSIIIAVFSFLLIGCAAKQRVQPLPIFEVQKGSKIGVVNFVSPRMKQYHIGTTIFNNFDKEHDVPWDLPSYINSEIGRQASESGYETVVIASNAKLKAKLSSCSIREGDKLILNPNIIPTIKSLAEEHKIKMLYIIEPFKSSLFVPNVEVPVEGYGVGTRNILLVGGVVAFARISAISICIDPLSLTKGAICSEEKDVTGLKMVGNFRSITDEDKIKYGNIIKNFVGAFVADILANSNIRS